MATRKRRKKKIKFNNLLILLVLLSSCFLIYNILLFGNIETQIRYIIIGFIILVNIIFFLIKQKKNKTIATIMMILFIIINIIGSLSINKVYSIIDSFNKGEVIYSSSLITLNDSSISTIDDVKKTKIGLIDDTMSIDNYVIAKEIIDEEKLDKNNEIVSYDDMLVMINDLYDKKIDCMFISSNYNSMFEGIEGYDDFGNKVKVITDKDKPISKGHNSFSLKSGNDIKPFSILLMGVDSEKDGLKRNGYANGDSLILMTFNPDTLNITMMSIPRDSYLPISCRDNKKNKLTHAGWFGTDCMIDTIENTFDTEINYYVKINFKGVVSLVNTLGGVTVDVPKRLCTDNSSRQGEICIDKGIQTLDGEGALVLARNRYDLSQGDIDRGYNQQLLIKAILSKLTEVRDVNDILDILETISNNIDTSLSTDEILSFYDIFKDILNSRKYQKTDDILNIIQIKVKGDGKMIYFDNLKRRLWTYQLDNNSIKEASDEMKINLGLKEPNIIKEFEFKP